MKKKLSLFLIIAMLSIFAAACGGADDNSSENQEGGAEGNGEAQTDEITISHELGETAVTKNPQKVVVFDFGILDSLDKLGVEVAAVPQATVPAYLEKYEGDEYVNAGSLKEPDFEAIAELGPDLIIISARQMELYEEFAEIGPTVYMPLDYENYMESFKGNMVTLAQIFDKEAEVEAKLAAVDEVIAGLKEKGEGIGKNALVILANEGNLSAYGPGSRFGIIHDEFGIPAVDESIEISTHGQNISPEYIVEMDPDYLFVIDRGAAVGGESSAKSIVETELVKTTKAFQDDNIVYLNPDYWYLSGGGLISVAEMVKEIEAGIQ
ncbi:siderophore ABC transporter substrate-binding protein [Bacillus dakarensis]|uniref:siderophore ABC transporter substrate-binding protein n=1 Tax=Robertmurraya dakarensis TaxID=1926278 RepID=UPI000981CEAC|nr:siderophore ABC transporter substrate-binding protein [Bacillus dakarensis]